jgi:hypothetical protein
MIEYANNAVLRVFCSAQALVANRRGADSLEWLAVAVIIIGAFVIAFGLFGNDINAVAERVRGWLGTN